MRGQHYYDAPGVRSSAFSTLQHVQLAIIYH